MEMPAAFVTAINAADFELNSARPNAPVVPHVERPQRARDLRGALVRRVTRAASVIKPA